MPRSSMGPRLIVLEVWAISLCVALFLGLFQALLMSDVWWIALVMIVVPVGLYLLLRRFVRAVAAGGRVAVITMYVVTAAHLILPVRQLLGSRPAGLDGILTALAALILFAALLPEASGRRA